MPRAARGAGRRRQPSVNVKEQLTLAIVGRRLRFAATNVHALPSMAPRRRLQLREARDVTDAERSRSPGFPVSSA
jgi:hypothetical protein